MSSPYHIHRNSEDHTPVFSILIPTWNNLEYLKCCVDSIRKNSTYEHQLILFVNEGSDGTAEWVMDRSLRADHIRSPVNVGICQAMNLSRPLARSDLLIYMNDDMYVLPGWDEALVKEIEKLDTSLFMISATMVEPVDTGNRCVVVSDHGTDLQSFDELTLLETKDDLVVPHWQGSTWPPFVLHRDTWDRVGGFSTEFSPGLYSDPDLSYKLLMAGVRHFMGVGSSLVYHFGSKSTSRIQNNRGRRTFLSKWGITANTFNKRILHLGTAFSGPLPDPDPDLRNRIIPRLKRMLNAMRKI